MSLSRALAGATAASALLLSGALAGCGVAGTSWSPGVAAEVGDRTVSTDRVDEVADDYCTAYEEELAQTGEAIPMGYLRSGVAGRLALVLAAEQLAEEYDVRPDPGYDANLAQLEQGVRSLPEEVQESVIEVESSIPYIQSILTPVGAQLLAEEGGEVSPEAATARGQEALAAWLEDNGARVDPQYGISIETGEPVPTDTNLSVAVGDLALQGSAEEPDPAYAASLPASQRCG